MYLQQLRSIGYWVWHPTAANLRWRLLTRCHHGFAWRRGLARGVPIVSRGVFLNKYWRHNFCVGVQIEEDRLFTNCSFPLNVFCFCSSRRIYIVLWVGRVIHSEIFDFMNSYAYYRITVHTLWWIDYVINYNITIRYKRISHSWWIIWKNCDDSSMNVSGYNKTLITSPKIPCGTHHVHHSK